MKKYLSNEAIRMAKPADKPYEIRDTKCDGLLLRVQPASKKNPSGVMTYHYEYQRGKRVKVGRAPSMAPDQARDAIKDINAAWHTTKKDPRDQKKPVHAGTYLAFLNDTYRPWLRINLAHGEYAYSTLTKAFPELHSLRLNEITPGVIESWRTKRLEDELDPSTINRQLSDLKACLRRARDIWDIEISDKLDRVKPCKIDRSPKVRYLSVAENKKLRKALDEREQELKSGEIIYAPRVDLSDRTFADHLKPAVLVSLNTGLRRGELLKLKWEDVHFDQRRLTVVGQTSKTGKTRHIPLNDEALSVLKAWKDQPGIKSIYVFAGPDGQPMHDMRSSWESILKRAKITNFRWHDLRHTFASNLVMAGENLNTVRELLGHADYKMTLRYAHLAPHHMQQAVDKLVACSN